MWPRLRTLAGGAPLVLAVLLPAGVTAESLAPAGGMHPMHTAVIEINYDPITGSTGIRIRAFVDDFGAAVPLDHAGAAADSAMAHYVRGTFGLTDRAGRVLPLRWEGAERSGDVIVLKLNAPAPGGLSGSKIVSDLLCDRFDDQVNIVRVAYGGRSTTLLFTRGDAAKVLP